MNYFDLFAKLTLTQVRSVLYYLQGVHLRVSIMIIVGHALTINFIQFLGGY